MKLTATEAFSAAFAIVRQFGSEFFYLSAAYAVLIAIAGTILDPSSALLTLTNYKNFPPEDVYPASRVIAAHWLVMALIGSGIAVVWVRLLNLSPAQLFEGGYQAFGRRILWVFWRKICASGWILRIFIPVFVVGVAISFVGNILSLGNIIGLLLSLVLGAFLIVLLCAVQALLYMAIISQSLDRPLTIKALWILRRAQLRDIGGLLLIVYVGAAFAGILLGQILGALAGSGDTAPIVTTFELLIGGFIDAALTLFLLALVNLILRRTGFFLQKEDGGNKEQG